MSTSGKHENGKKEIAHETKAAPKPPDVRNVTLRSEIESGLTKIADCGQRINDNLPVSGQPFRDPGYVAKQLAYLIDAAQGMQRSLEAHHRPATVPAAEKTPESKES